MTDERPVVLEVDDLRTWFFTSQGIARAVDGVSFSIRESETVGIVGESGCGKSVTALSVMRLLEDQARIVSGAIRFRGRDVIAMEPAELRAMRGGDVAMVFQDPMTSLNPVIRIARQLSEAMTIHGQSGAAAARRGIGLLGSMGIGSPERAMRSYPHQFSGGMRQRVVLAMGMSNEPALLLADEPTTALDVTIQAQILELLRKLQRETGMAILLITHDLGVVAENADVVNVMYASRIVETATVEDLFDHPMHPYTEGLFRSVPKLGATSERLATIPGTVPNPANFPSGCKFHTRCPLTREKAHGRAVGVETITVNSGSETFEVLKRCHDEEPLLREIQTQHWAACHQIAGYDQSPLTEPRLEHKREVVPQVSEEVAS
jgi:peptide/nickel transport system ATP-binding protein